MANRGAEARARVEGRFREHHETERCATPNDRVHVKPRQLQAARLSKKQAETVVGIEGGNVSPLLTFGRAEGRHRSRKTEEI
jgi:uncharacterized protein YcgI (DUF1989 family)